MIKNISNPLKYPSIFYKYLYLIVFNQKLKLQKYLAFLILMIKNSPNNSFLRILLFLRTNSFLTFSYNYNPIFWKSIPLITYSLMNYDCYQLNF